MEIGEEPRHREAASNEESRKVGGAARVSIAVIVVALLIGFVFFGWMAQR